MKKTKILKLIFILPLLTNVFSCSLLDEDSDEIATANIFADINIQSENASNIKLEVSLNENEALGKSLTLTGGDVITASFRGETIQLTEEAGDLLLDIVHEGAFNTNGEIGEVTVTLTRGDGSQVISSVILPENFEISFPNSGDRYTEGDSLTTIWSPAGADGSIVSSHGYLNCATVEHDGSPDFDSENETRETSDTGSYDFHLAELISSLKREVSFERENIVVAVPCTFTMDLTRLNTGEVAAEFATGSKIKAQQIRKVDGMEFIAL